MEMLAWNIKLKGDISYLTLLFVTVSLFSAAQGFWLPLCLNRWLPV
jgi:hypothetical protein